MINETSVDLYEGGGLIYRDTKIGKKKVSTKGEIVANLISDNIKSLIFQFEGEVEQKLFSIVIVAPAQSNRVNYRNVIMQ